jgi:hypothetical protein
MGCSTASRSSSLPGTRLPSWNGSRATGTGSRATAIGVPRRLSLALVALVALSLSAAPALAQPAAQPVSTPRIVGGAVLGAAAGALIGGFAGGSFTSRDCGNNPDYCLGAALPGFVWGVGTGHTLGAPIGAHLANRRQGNLVQSVLVSSALFATEVLVLRSFVRDGRTEHKSTALAVVTITPVLQVIVSSMLESRTTGR